MIFRQQVGRHLKIYNLASLCVVSLVWESVRNRSKLMLQNINKQLNGYDGEERHKQDTSMLEVSSTRTLKGDFKSLYCNCVVYFFFHWCQELTLCCCLVFCDLKIFFIFSFAISNVWVEKERSPLSAVPLCSN